METIMNPAIRFLVPYYLLLSIGPENNGWMEKREYLIASYLICGTFALSIRRRRKKKSKIKKKQIRLLINYLP
ncbi:hypothetical protein BD408DRAFT_420974 [Parasitella parasitica]|nr:hypothetical protein BD408DRAFT_420974 [Parasitella parasitica]